MKVLIWGGEVRYRADLPHAVQSLPLELVFCPREQPLESMFPQHADTVFLFVDAIAPVDDAFMDRMPGLRLIHSEGVAYNAIDLDAARRRSIFVCNNKGCNAAPTAEMAVMLMLMSALRLFPVLLRAPPPAAGGGGRLWYLLSPSGGAVCPLRPDLPPLRCDP